ncbi:hypothetical protein [Chitinophaga rhizophila]|uniref:Uncharacterized protein n=1 Tax=Chitinophaga rhizophila TaxID=2866212 RepID=A0ABS7GIE8_9BACT|nr:hypothetical protein [Chitinophaga rhizophila]MBW8687473.1 hypothetical protein [Chitinophaga rhizophila]
MAKQTSLITFTGRLSQMVGYRRGGRYFLRSIPAVVRQTAATRNAALRFGIASKQSALIRSAFKPILDVCCDTSHINRLNKVLIQAGRQQVTAVQGFRFNQYTGIDRFLPTAPVLSAEKALHIPAQVVAKVKGVDSLEVKIITALISFGLNKVVGTSTTSMTVKAGARFEGATIPVDICGTGTLVVVMQIRAMYQGQVVSEGQYAAADIVAVAPVNTARLHYPQELGQPPVAMPYYPQQHQAKLRAAYHLLVQRE